MLDQAKALVALVRLLARLAAREAWDDGQARHHDPVDAPGDVDSIPAIARRRRRRSITISPAAAKRRATMVA
jgi:hypothetical protein